MQRPIWERFLGEFTIAGEFLANPCCRKVTFTGYSAVGRRLVAGAAARLKQGTGAS